MLAYYLNRRNSDLWNDYLNRRDDLDFWDKFFSDSPLYKELKENFRVSEKDGVKRVNFDVPGIPKEKLEVSWKDDYLSIKGNHDKRKIEHRVYFPEVDVKTLKAESLDGVLTVSANVKTKEDGAVTVTVL